MKTSSRPHRFSPFLPPFEPIHNSPGIYKISLPEVTELIYIGSAAQSIRKRWRVHLNDLVKKRHGNDRLQNTVNKYGLDKLRFEVLEICPAEAAIEREQFWIEQHQWEQLFNVNPKASSRLGATLTPEDRLMLAAKHGGVSSQETLARIAEEYADGATQIELAAKYEVDRSSIRNYLKRLGANLRKKATEDAKTISRVLALYEHHTPKVVAQMVGIDPETVRKIARENGVFRNNSAAQKKRMTRADARQKQAEAVGGNLFSIAHAEHGTITGYQFELAGKTGFARKDVSELCRGLIEDLHGWHLVSAPKFASHKKSGIKQHSFIHRKHGEFLGSVSELRRAYPKLKQAGLSLLTTGEILSYKGWEIKNGENHTFSKGMGHKRGGEAKNIPNRKIPLSEYEAVRQSLIAGESQTTVAKRYGVTQSVISRLRKRQGW